MTVRVLLFAQLAESIDEREIWLALADGATVSDALRALAREQAPIAQMDGRLAVAVNDRYAARDAILSHGDTLALIPPVSGG